jgi:hypothetical protein
MEMTSDLHPTRRGLLHAMTVVAGSFAAYRTMVAHPKVAMAAAPASLGRGKRVLILGAGVGGICAAYELER